ncbi:hypothetical protein [Sporichthya polymorpha]|uniref:hypothetical protein n=1 Tax=Sporichthya polymorpha TaxID=35751 RepID=UPI00036CCFD0|nr:hypothetical protein [Sporichthya polymorpha]
MSMTARERAILDATAADLLETAPALAGFLAEGPHLLRIQGVPPKEIDGLVPDWQPPSRRTRMKRRLGFGKPRLMRPPEL